MKVKFRQKMQTVSLTVINSFLYVVLFLLFFDYFDKTCTRKEFYVNLVRLNTFFTAKHELQLLNTTSATS